MKRPFKPECRNILQRYAEPGRVLTAVARTGWHVRQPKPLKIWEISVYSQFSRSFRLSHRFTEQVQQNRRELLTYPQQCPVFTNINHDGTDIEIGRVSCRERVYQYV